MVRDLAGLPEKISVCLNGVQIAHHEVERAILCSGFRARPFFSHSNFFLESGTSRMKKVVSFVRTICEGSAFDPWGSIGVCGGSLSSDLKSCREKIVVRRKTSKESR